MFDRVNLGGFVTEIETPACAPVIQIRLKNDETELEQLREENAQLRDELSRARSALRNACVGLEKFNLYLKGVVHDVQK